VVLGRTLVSLLDEACERNPNPRAFNQRLASDWQSLSTQDFRRRAEHLAMGLLAMGLQRGDRVAFYTRSDISFCLGDMACLVAGLIDVPIYLTHAPGAISHILNETEARALIVSDEQLLGDIESLLARAPHLEAIVLQNAPAARPPLPTGLTLSSFVELEARGRQEDRADSGRLAALKAEVQAGDLATIIYTSGTTGLPKGVMLTHENISSNVVAAITGMTTFRRRQEVAISFLPLTHIFARTLQYALMWYGTSIYYSHPEHLREHLLEVRPTFFAAVPRVLEKAYERILEAGKALTGIKRRLFDRALELARRYRVEHPPGALEAWQYRLADRLVFSKWREALGGRIRTIIVGGAALRPELVEVFGAAGIDVLQGYGLTETSPVIAYNRPNRNRSSTVGPLLAGVEVRIGSDGEILTRGPNIMKGYYRHSEKTAEAIDQDGWFHTGDLGEFTADGFLKIIGRLKNLFKLSTGKYVMPQPLEEKLESHPLIGAALVVGEGEKYCTALLFIHGEKLGGIVGGPVGTGDLERPAVQESFREVVTSANRGLPHWSTVKKAALLLEPLTIEGGMLTPKLSVRRAAVLERYRPYLEAMYGDGDHHLEGGVIVEL